MMDPPPPRPARSQTVERITRLLKEKQRRRQELEDQHRIRRLQSEERKEEHQRVMDDSEMLSNPREPQPVHRTPPERFGWDDEDEEEKPVHANPNKHPPPREDSVQTLMEFGAASEQLSQPHGHKQPSQQQQHELSRAQAKSAEQSSFQRSVSQASRGLLRSASRVQMVGAYMNEDRKKMLENAQFRRQYLQLQADSMLGLLESNPTRGNLRKARSMRSFMKKQVKSRLQGSSPRFARLVTLVQLALMVLMTLDGGVASWGLGIVETRHEVPLFEGTGIQPVQRAQNPFLGPEPETLVRWGSKWTPCMREDEHTDELLEADEKREENAGCCMNSDSECGMMQQSSCPGTFFGNGTLCSAVPQCRSIKLRPCCHGIHGQCALVTKEHCDVLDGLWNEDKELCGQSKCLLRSCGMGYDTVGSLSSTEQPNQFYRFVTAIFLHVGWLHFALNVVGQYFVVSRVEFAAGSLRTSAMYLTSGACGFMVSALLSAGDLANGSSAAIYGMLGVETVDLFQSWQLIDSKSRQVTALAIKLAVYLGIGTLPFVDNFAHVGGFATGVVAGTCLLPYIVFGTFDGLRKRLFQVLSAVGLAALTIGLLHTFYTDKEVTCSWCTLINCVPYTDSICDTA